MTVTHPHLLEKAIRQETTRMDRIELLYYGYFCMGEEAAFRIRKTISRIRADYKRRVQKKGRKIAA